MATFNGDAGYYDRWVAFGGWVVTEECVGESISEIAAS
jgi:hypothetical protein